MMLLGPAASALASPPSAAASLRTLALGFSITTMEPSSSLGSALKRERLGGLTRLGGWMLGVRARDSCGCCTCCFP